MNKEKKMQSTKACSPLRSPKIKTHLQTPQQRQSQIQILQTQAIKCSISEKTTNSLLSMNFDKILLVQNKTNIY